MYMFYLIILFMICVCYLEKNENFKPIAICLFNLARSQNSSIVYGRNYRQVYNELLKNKC